MKPPRYTKKMVERYVKQGYWLGESYIDRWDRNALQYPDREALVDSRSRLTWSQAKVLSDRLALGLLGLGLKREQVVVMQLPNSVESCLTRLALQKAGLLGLPVMMYFRHQELKYALQRTKAVAIVIRSQFGNQDYLQLIEELRPQLPDLKHIIVVGDNAPQGTIPLQELMAATNSAKLSPQLLAETRIRADEVTELRMTSGTTGFPKLVALVAESLAVAGRTNAKRFRLSPDDTVAALAPIIGGGSGVLCWTAAPFAAPRIVLLERFEAEEALKLLERERVTVASGVPAQLAMMVKHPNFAQYDLSALRAFCYAGSSCPYGLAQEAEGKLGCRLLTALGSIDAGTLASTSYDDPPEVRLASVGKPMPGAEIKLLDEAGQELPPGDIGEIAWRGPSCFPGYYEDREATLAAWGGKADGFYGMGDLGRFDEAGDLYVVGRRKDMIIRGGQNVYPVEIEGLLIGHPKILDVSVVSMPDPIFGEKSCAFVIPRPRESLTLEEVVSFLREKKIAPYKLPERLELVDRFPLIADGQKVLKRQLTEEVTRKLRSEGKIV